MIGNQNTNILILEFGYNRLNIFNSNRVNAGKWFI